MEGSARRQSSRHRVLMPDASGNQGEDTVWLGCHDWGKGKSSGFQDGLGGAWRCSIDTFDQSCGRQGVHSLSSGRKLTATKAATAETSLQNGGAHEEACYRARKQDSLNLQFPNCAASNAWIHSSTSTYPQNSISVSFSRTEQRFEGGC